eukprot:560357-Prorocentrum_minimum.AAC.5
MEEGRQQELALSAQLFSDCSTFKRLLNVLAAAQNFSDCSTIQRLNSQVALPTLLDRLPTG